MPRPSSPLQLPPRAAVALGLVFAVVGLIVIAAAFRITPTGAAGETPRWVGAAAGLVFVLLGATVIIGFAVAGGAAADGDLPPGTPFGVRLAQYGLGLAIVALLTAIFSWIAFGPGPRQFIMTGLPALGPRAAETVGRAVFGLGAGLMAVFFVVLAIVSVGRLRRSK